MTTKPAPSAAFAALRAVTAARLEVGRAGTRVPTTPALALEADRARARDAGAAALPAAWAKRHGLIELATDDTSARGRTDAGTLGRAARARLRRCRRRPDVQIVLAGGPTPVALAAGATAFLGRLTRRLRASRRRLGTSLFVRQAGDGAAEQIAAALRPRVLCFVTSERPTPRTPESLAVQLRFQPAGRGAEPVRTAVSGVHAGGLPPAEAAEAVAAWIDSMLGRR
jgi:ethanolamine ammonia-lyase small subunit